ncbi:MAG: 23S rRNA (cytosine(1962)-C(5))-methyltransferase RlmI, partial [bacterium]
MPSAILKQGRDRSLQRRHPWVFSGAIAQIEGKPQAGETVDVCTANGTIIARGAYSPGSQITIRIWT